MKKFLKLTVFASSFAIATSIASADQFIRMVSGPSGSSWYPLGAKIMQVMQDKIKGTATSNTSGGGISNVMSVDVETLNSGSLMHIQLLMDLMEKVNSKNLIKMLDTLQHYTQQLFK